MSSGDSSPGRRVAVTPEYFLRPFGGLDPGVGSHVRAKLGVSSHCPRTEILRDMALWLMTCEATGEAAGPRSLSFGPSANWMRL